MAGRAPGRRGRWGATGTDDGGGRVVRRPALRLAVGAAAERRQEEVAAEAALTLYVDGEELVTLLCTPADLEELVVGYLAAEGVIDRPDDLRWLAVDAERGEAWTATRGGAGQERARASARRLVGSCCGKSRPGLIWQADLGTVRSGRGRGPRLTPAAAARAMAELRGAAAADVFGRTGGVHDAGLARADGSLVVRRMDIGRHNALDKLYGHVLLRGLGTEGLIAAVSGRISAEVLLKVAKMGVTVLLSKAAPTSLALDLAEELGMTAVGFVREGRMTVYTGAWRILAAGQEEGWTAANTGTTASPAGATPEEG